MPWVVIDSKSSASNCQISLISKDIKKGGEGGQKQTMQLCQLMTIKNWAKLVIKACYIYQMALHGMAWF